MTFLAHNKHHNMMISIMLIVLSYLASFYDLPRPMIRLLQYGSLSFLLLAAFLSTPGSKYKFPRSFIFSFLLIWSVIILVRGLIDVQGGYESFVKIISDPKMFMVYFFPLLLGCSALSFDYKGFCRVCSVLTLLFAIIVLTNLQDIITSSVMGALDISYGDEEKLSISGIVAVASVPMVLFLQRDILPKRVWRTAFLNLLLILFVSLINARRSTTFGVLLILFFGYLKEKRLRWVSVLAVVALVYAMYVNGFLDFILAKGNTDTRSGVVTAFLEDMDSRSWIFGRGAAGTYYDAHTTFDNIDGIRTEIETGYLYLILKGGIPYLVIYVYSLGYAAFLGIKRSNNVLCHSFGIFILISLLELIPYGVPTWNLKFFAIWMGVAICLNPSLRAMSNQEVKDFFGLEK